MKKKSIKIKIKPKQRITIGNQDEMSQFLYLKRKGSSVIPSKKDKEKRRKEKHKRNLKCFDD